MRTLALVLFLTVAISGYAQAQQGGGKPRGGPPPEAFEACEESRAGDYCSFTGRRGDAEGICEKDRRGSDLICAPEDGPRPDTQSARADGPPDRGGPDGQNGRPMRAHSVTSSSGLTPAELYPAIAAPISPTQYNETIDGDWRVITANSIASHKTGEFPNPGNPSTIQEQSIKVRVPANPQVTANITRVKEPGYSLEGVKFDPGAGEFYKGKPSLGWQYEALSGAVPLGLDENHAHVQPTGHYHYHGLPTALMAGLGIRPGVHSAQIGWAVDGFPIYSLYGYADPANIHSNVITMTSSYQLKRGTRPSYGDNPGGAYDGTFGADYEYVEGLGTLDECNGRFTITPDYPNGTYAYFLTETYPVVPRCVKGTPEIAKRGGPPRRN